MIYFEGKALDNIKLLGLTFQSDGGGRKSWDQVLCRVQGKLGSWSARPLTITGKILVLKAIVLPALLYVGRVFPPDRASGKTITRMAFQFVWGSTFEKLSRATLLKDEDKGGRGVPDMVNIILAQGLATLVQNTRKGDKAVCAFARHYATPFLRTMGLSVLDHRMPYSWDPPYVYRALRAFALGTGLPGAGLTSRHLALTENCPHGCTDSEHVHHVFWDCSVARRVWGLVVSSVSLNRLLPRSSLTSDSVLYGPPGGCKTIELQRQWRIINTIKQVLWETRNIKVYQQQNVDLVTLRRRIQNLLQDGVVVDFRKNERLAKEKWGVDHWKELSI
ncbi:hypothetical protein JZ751_011086 [Albula glossodonta]|uniref:Reverse transcriptase zinc-binding domain-containing protein n=1 Tax=Albula glossodonta TaxID=121402 RepID=A0A8T2NY18_9TELE|nr:hypothetical protein JZ751_011086 [Albula glossodonta]